MTHVGCSDDEYSMIKMSPQTIISVNKIPKKMQMITYMN